MNKEFIVNCVSIPKDDKFFLDLRIYNVKLLSAPDVFGGVPDGEGRELIWRGLFVAYEVHAPNLP